MKTQFLNLKRSKFFGLILLFILFSFCASSQVKQNTGNFQISFIEHSVDENFGGASAIAVFDVDKDGFPDILGASEYAQGTGGNGISWWRNNNDGTWTRNIIDQTLFNIMSLQLCDVNNDNNIDVLVSDWGIADEVACFTSDNENPPNWSKTIIVDNFTYAHDAFCADINNDELMDIAGVSAGGEIKVWYQSTNKSWIEQTVNNDFLGGRAVYVADIDQDGDFDIIAASLGDERKTVLYKNNGNDPVVWTEQVIDDTYGGHHIHAFDFDQDNDTDILISSTEAGEILWWKNNGGNPIVWEKENVAFFESACRALPCDFDNDGDYDILGSGILSDELSVWYNQGGEPFLWTKTTITNQLDRVWPSFICDIDCDGDYDFVAGASGTGVIRWWENNLYSSSSIQINEKKLISILTNPVNDILSLRINENINSCINIELYNLSGVFLKEFSVNSLHYNIDISDLPSGFFFLKVRNENEVAIEKFIKN